MFQRILLTTDFSYHARCLLELTLRFAREFGSHVVLLHVDEEERLFPLRSSDSLIRFFNEIAVRREAAMEALARRIAAAGVEVTQTRAKGIASEEVLALARAQAVDLIAISTVGIETTKRTLIGSTAKQVLRHAPCPVLVTNPFCPHLPDVPAIPAMAAEEETMEGEGGLSDESEQALAAEALAQGEEGEAASVPAGAEPQEKEEEEEEEEEEGEEKEAAQPTLWPPIRRVLAPLNVEQHPQESLRFAFDVARRFDAALELLYVLKVPSFFPSLPGEPPLTLPHESLSPVTSEAAVRLANMAAEMSGGRVEWTVTIAADEAEEIAAHARRSQADLLVLPRRASTAFGALLFGRVAAAVAKMAPVPLLLYVPRER